MGCHSKKLSERIHSRRRFFERYGQTFTKNMEWEIIKKIQNNNSVLIERKSCTRTKRVVSMDGKEVTLIYDSKRHSIVTFLPTKKGVYNFYTPLDFSTKQPPYIII